VRRPRLPSVCATSASSLFSGLSFLIHKLRNKILFKLKGPKSYSVGDKCTYKLEPGLQVNREVSEDALGSHPLQAWLWPWGPSYEWASGEGAQGDGSQGPGDSVPALTSAAYKAPIDASPHRPPAEACCSAVQRRAGKWPEQSVGPVFWDVITHSLRHADPVHSWFLGKMVCKPSQKESHLLFCFKISK
jgi:hypothetical protein